MNLFVATTVILTGLDAAVAFVPPTTTPVSSIISRQWSSTVRDWDTAEAPWAKMHVMEEKTRCSSSSDEMILHQIEQQQAEMEQLHQPLQEERRMNHDDTVSFAMDLDLAQAVSEPRIDPATLQQRIQDRQTSKKQQQEKPSSVKKAIRMAKLSSRLYGPRAMQSREAWNLVGEMMVPTKPKKPIDYPNQPKLKRVYTANGREQEVWAI
mmetsp:Transcript_437/g.986  ORF Transcript_437/g.986 Transcript_437/m.986 type:complete len:209 (-) Transcript_437:189-815(-)